MPILREATPAWVGENTMGLQSKPNIAQMEAETQAEIEKIMSEIEQLQAGMAKPDENPPAEPSLRLVPESQEGALDEFRGGEGDASLEDTLANLKGDEGTGHGLLDQAVNGETERAEDAGEGDQMLGESTSDGTLSMTLTGSMVLKLKYEHEGQEVRIGFANGSLEVKLPDGTEFKIPVRRNTDSRRVA